MGGGSHEHLRWLPAGTVLPAGASAVGLDLVGTRTTQSAECGCPEYVIRCVHSPECLLLLVDEDVGINHDDSCAVEVWTDGWGQYTVNSFGYGEWLPCCIPGTTKMDYEEGTDRILLVTDSLPEAVAAFETEEQRILQAVFGGKR